MIYQKQNVEIAPIYQLLDIDIGNQTIIQQINISAFYKDVEYVFCFDLINQNTNWKLILQYVKEGEGQLQKIDNVVCDLKEGGQHYNMMTNIINRYLLDK